MPSSIRIGNRIVGAGEPCFIVAEAGVNHNGSLKVARQLVEAALQAGADAVKFQTFRAKKLAGPHAPLAEYQRSGTGGIGSQRNLLRRLELSQEDHRELFDLCRKRGILFLSTPFDEESADFLEDLGVPAFKIASGELTNLPLLKHVARKGKPVIVSTGMSTLAEVRQAVGVLLQGGARQLVLLHCVSRYPAEPQEMNLRAMGTLSKQFHLPVGLSDHTLGTEVACASVALGACVVEKHFTLDRTLPGPDHRASLEPRELEALVRGIRKVEAALGDGRKAPAASELEIARVARRSLVAACHIPAGSRLTQKLVAVRRPGTGLPPAELPRLLGRKVRKALAAGTPLTLEMVS